MTWLWFVAGALLVAYLARRRFVRKVLAAVGRQAVDAAPDRIRLQAVSAHSWTDENAAESATEALVENGFVEAGTYRVPEMPGVTVRLLANPAESVYAAIYAHPQAGLWLDLFARYQGHTSVTFTTSRVTGLEARPGHRIVHAPGMSAFRLCERAFTEMPEGTLRPVSVDRAVHDFEEAYAESVAWRKARGVSAREVAGVARRKAA
jgi:hypothetical protein